MFSGKNVVIKIDGGLGNQLFEYATAYSYCKTNEKNLIIDISAFNGGNTHPLRLNCLSITDKFVTRKIAYHAACKVLKRLCAFFNIRQFYFEKGLGFDSELLNNKKVRYLSGFFQSEKYFIEYRSDLLELFNPASSLSDYQKSIKNYIRQRKTISMHIRRGDYLSNPKAKEIHGACDKKYFDKALKYLIDNSIINKEYSIIVFSDDISWCRENINFNFDMVFVEGDQDSPEKDMHLMSLCEHNIISNSTFSWWAAWLNLNDNKVIIAPHRWFNDDKLDSKDIVPDCWIKL